MSQIPGIVMIPDVPLFIITIALLAIVILGGAVELIKATDLQLWKREIEKMEREAYQNLTSYVEISAQGLLSDRWEILYQAHMSHTCIQCGRSYLDFHYQVYRDNAHPEQTILFGSHFCPAIKDRSSYDAQKIAGAYVDDVEAFMKRFQWGERGTVEIPILTMGDLQDITAKRQRVIGGPHLTALLEEMSN